MRPNSASSPLPGGTPGEALAAVAPKVRVVWRANPGPQSAMLCCPARFVLYGGAAGGGKSVALVVDALGLTGERLDGRRWARQIDVPSYRALILRVTYPELQELEAIAASLYPDLVPGARWNGSTHTWTFPSGAQVMFGYTGTVFERFMQRYRGIQFSYLGWDEACDQEERAFVWLLSRLRNADPRVWLRVRLTANPQGKGVAWVKARFVAPAPPRSLFRSKSGHVGVFIPAKLVDNPSLAATDYLEGMKELTEADQAALIDGDWDAYQGRVFRLTEGENVWTWAQFRARTGHAVIPAHWARYRVMDWGLNKPGAIYWIAVDEQGHGYVYREWYTAQRDPRGQVMPNVGARLLPERVAEGIRDIEAAARESVAGAWSGPDIGHHARADHVDPQATHMMEQRTIEQRFASYGVSWRYWDASPGSRRAALTEFARAIHVPEGGQPHLIIIKEACPEAIRTIPTLDWDPHMAGDIDTDGEDHCYDALKGFCLMHTWPTRPATEKSPKWMEAGAGRSAFVV